MFGARSLSVPGSDSRAGSLRWKAADLWRSVREEVPRARPLQRRLRLRKRQMPLLQEKVTASPSSCETLTTHRIYLTPTNTDSTRSPYFDSVKLNGPNSGKLTGSLIYILLHEPNHGSTRGLGVFHSPPFKFYLGRTRDNDDRGNCTVFSVGVVLSKSCTFPHLASKQILCRHLRLLETENTLTPFRNCRLSYMAPPSSVELPRQAGRISNIFG